MDSLANLDAGEPPDRRLGEALKIVTFHANRWKWANETFGRARAVEGADPAASLGNLFRIGSAPDGAGAARARSVGRFDIRAASAYAALIPGSAGFRSPGVGGSPPASASRPPGPITFGGRRCSRACQNASPASSTS